MTVDAPPKDQGGLAAERLLVPDVTSCDLSSPSSPGLWVTGGWPTAMAENLAELGPAKISLWQAGVGVVDDIERDEVDVCLAGAATIRFEHGESIDVRPGTCVWLRTGDRAEWTITSDLRLLTIAL